MTGVVGGVKPPTYTTEEWHRYKSIINNHLKGEYSIMYIYTQYNV